MMSWTDIRWLVQHALNGEFRAIAELKRLGFDPNDHVPASAGIKRDYGAEVRAELDQMAERIAEAKRLGLPESES